PGELGTWCLARGRPGSKLLAPSSDLLLAQGTPMPPTSSTVQAASLSADKVRQILNRWAGESWFRLPAFGDKARIDEIAARCSYPVKLWTEYEDRWVSKATKPFAGGSVDDLGRPPDLWDLPVRRPTDFEDRTETLQVPHTERVQTCSAC